MAGINYIGNEYYAPKLKLKPMKMLPLTNLEKVEILKKALKLIELDIFFNICLCIYYICPIYYSKSKCRGIQNDFNMEKYKPIDKSESDPWFEYNLAGKIKRIEIIKELITEFEQLT